MSKFNVILSSTPSDSHQWNLVFLEYFLRERGCNVENLGMCVPYNLLFEKISEIKPELVVISSLNGHLFQEGGKIIQIARSKGLDSNTRFIIGGKPSINLDQSSFFFKKLKMQGFDKVFLEMNP